MDDPEQPADEAPPRESPVRESPVTVAVRYLPLVMLAAVVGLLTRFAAQPVTNPDSFFHLRFGEEFLRGDWSLRHPGTVTTFGTREWVPTQWLSEIVMAVFNRSFGLPGVGWLTGVAVLSYALALFVVSRRHAPALAAVFVTILAVLASGSGLSPRPQVLSYVFIVLVTGAWMKALKDGRPPWWLLVLAWIWPLVHGMWLLGIVTSAVAALGVVLERSDLDRGARLRILSVPALMAVVSALTPIGPSVYGAVAVVGSRNAYFTEWAPPDYQKPAQLLLAVLLAVLLVVALRTGPSAWFLTLMIVLAAGWAVYSTRTVPVAAAMAAPLTAQVLARVMPKERVPTERRDIRYARGLVLVALVALAFVVPHTVTGPQRPAWFTSELGSLPPGTKVLASDGDSGYLMWRYPNLDLVANGYGDLFTDAELARNADISNVAPGWDSDLGDLGVRRVLADPNSAIGYALVTSQGWDIVQKSGRWEYLVAPPGWDGR